MAEVTGLAALRAAGIQYTIISETVEREKVANSTEAPYSVTFKTGRNTLITVRGESHDELAANLGAMAVAIPGPDGPESVVDIIAEIERHLSGAAAPAAQGGSQAAQQSSLTPPCPVCQAQTTEKSGTGKRGPWKGYFCTANKDHAPQWA